MIVSLSDFAVAVSYFKFIQSTLSDLFFLFIQTAYKFVFDEFIYFIMNFTLSLNEYQSKWLVSMKGQKGDEDS